MAALPPMAGPLGKSHSSPGTLAATFIPTQQVCPSTSSSDSSFSLGGSQDDKKDVVAKAQDVCQPILSLSASAPAAYRSESVPAEYSFRPSSWACYEGEDMAYPWGLPVDSRLAPSIDIVSSDHPYRLFGYNIQISIKKCKRKTSDESKPAAAADENQDDTSEKKARGNETALLDFFEFLKNQTSDAAVRGKLQHREKADEALASITRLTLSGMSLPSLDPSIRYLISLKILDLWHNELTDLPDDLRDLPLLEKLDLRNNKFTKVPDVVNRIFAEVILTDNEILFAKIASHRQNRIRLPKNCTVTLLPH